MKFKSLLSGITTITLMAAAAEPAADGRFTLQRGLTLEGAKRVAAAAEAYAKANGATPSIAVVDAAGTLLHFVRLDGSFPAATTVSIGKAKTAATFRKPTKEFEDIINRGRFTMTTLPEFTPLQGGVPILSGGMVVGAIGVSGAKSAAQDEEVAKAGGAAVSETDASESSK